MVRRLVRRNAAQKARGRRNVPQSHGTRAQLQSARAERPAARDQRRLISLRRKLLPELPPQRATRDGLRHWHVAPRLSMRRHFESAENHHGKTAKQTMRLKLAALALGLALL